MFYRTRAQGAARHARNTSTLNFHYIASPSRRIDCTRTCAWGPGITRPPTRMSVLMALLALLAQPARPLLLRHALAHQHGVMEVKLLVRRALSSLA